ncbi:MAG: hypothetical protein K5869_09740 [Saccharofermentans sp.]|nr:hypothetical protein [Saccharofermentans sp.]
MISLYKKYHIIYWCIGIIEIIGMVTANLLLCRHSWYPAIPVTAVTVMLVMVDAFIFIRLFAKKTQRSVVSLYNSIVASGYGVPCGTSIN